MTETLPNSTEPADGAYSPHHGNFKPLIMVVGPNEENRFMLKTVLELWEYEVLEAGDPDESVRLGAERHPSLILMDTTLQFEDDLKNMGRIMHSDGMANIPSVLMSGFSQDIYRDAALSSGASGFLVKPIDFDVLREYIIRLLDGNTLSKKQGSLSQ